MRNIFCLHQKYMPEALLLRLQQLCMLIHPVCYKYTSWKSFSAFMHFSLKEKQIRWMPLVINALQPVLNRPELQYLNLEIIALCNARLLEVNCHQESIDLIKYYSHFILSVPLSFEEDQCDVRHKHCILLLTLLNVYQICEDETNIHHVLNKLQILRKFSFEQGDYLCYCFISTSDCKEMFSTDEVNIQTNLGITKTKYDLVLWKHIQIYEKEQIKDLSWFYDDPIKSIKTLTIKISKGELGLDWYLKCMISALELEEDLEHLWEDVYDKFLLLTEQFSVYNETGLYDIIKSLCDLEMQPEIQDIFIQGLTEYTHVKCYEHNSILSYLLLDINTTCYQGEFLQKLTINMGQHLLSIEEDTGNRVEKIIYRCFCIVRHEHKVNANKETNLEKYKIYFSFIQTMEAQEEMEKLSHFKSYLAILLLKFSSSGGLHKSAKSKKYLWLKYEYEDAILYLLWCSGDVEVNPGPTFKKLRPQADSVKKRNWIHEMCTKTLKLIKNKAVDSKTDGLWKEKPDIWQELHASKPFYDPRNKPKSKQFSIKTDEELLNCLLKCCDYKSIKFSSSFEREITAWKSNKVLLFELCVTRQEIYTMKIAKDLLITYRVTPNLKQNLQDFNVDLTFNPNNAHFSQKGYSDVVRDLAITFCRISKGLPIFEKSDGIWKTQPRDWNRNHLYFSPCNTAKRDEKHQDQQLVDNLLSYCEKKSIPIPSELQLVVKAWKQRDSHEICKRYTIWSCIVIIQHSLKYLEIEGLLEKPHVQQSLKQIGISPVIHWNSNNDSIINTDTDNKVSEFPRISILDNQRDTCSRSPSASDLHIACKQHPYEARALTNCHSMKSVITCQNKDFQTKPSTSGYRGVSQSTDEQLEILDSYKSIYKTPCTKPDFQSSSSECSICINRASSQKDKDNFLSTNGIIQKRKRAISEDRSDKKLAHQSGTEYQASTRICRSSSETTPSSHCYLDIADQIVEKSFNMHQDSCLNRIPVPDKIHDLDSSNNQFSGSGDDLPKQLLQYLDTYIRCDNLEELEEDIEDIDRQLKLWES